MWKIDNTPGDYRIVDDSGMTVFRGSTVDAILTHFAMVMQQHQQLRQALAEEVVVLEQWAEASRTGGWSTHQVEAQKKRADEIRRVLMPGGRMEVLKP